MILYFSATGNCEYIAKTIGEATDDIALPIGEIGNTFTMQEGERLGFVLPTYFWGLPSYVEEFMARVNIRNAKEIYCVMTYGSTVGQADKFLNKLLKKQGLRLTASYGIKTVDNWVVDFPVNDETEVAELLAEEEKQLQAVIASVKAGEQVFIDKDKKPFWLCKGARYYYDKARKTKHLQATGDCIGCGLCASDCPCGAIELHDGKPVWVKTECTMCFRCLHRCPTSAIEYDGKTRKNGQYTHPPFEKK